MSPALPRRAALAARIMLLAAALLLSASASAPAAVKRPPSAAKALSSLVTQTNGLSRAWVATGRRARLVRLARHARRVVTSSPCGSVRDMASYRRALKTTKVRPRLRRALRNRALARLAKLNAGSTAASRSLLTSKRTRRCGGGVTPSTLSKAKATLSKSDENGLTLRVQLPQLQFVPETEGGKTYTKLVAPGTESAGAPGTPGIPISSSIIAVPDGATLEVKTSNVQSQTIDGVEVFPAQPDPVDQGPGLAPKPNFFAGPFAEQPFKLDAKTYGKNALVPAAPAFGKKLGQARDMNIAGLHFPSAQYNPKTDKLKVLTQVEVQVTFAGGTKTFSDAPASPWETAQRRLVGSLLNSGVVSKFERPIVFQPCGEELLVITSPATLTSANTYATARRNAGYLTRVFQTGTAAVGSTATSIQAFIRSHLNHPLCIRPSYVTIIGDDEFVPTFTTGPGAIPSDNPYSTKNDTDELPDVAVGRILGNDVAQLDAQIAKIIHYETTPPAGPMLTRALMAAQFQDTDDAGEVNDGAEDRTFIQFAETARSGLAARGVAVDRIYDDNPTTNPLKFNDGTDLPASLKKPTFPWDGDGADVSAAWNQGRFMVVHRDHGWSDGWGDPFFTTTEVDALTNDNDNLPVVLSINCASARYDDDETSFVQNALVKPTGGAVGAFGDTRNSPSWHNSQIALGFIDALLPSVLAGEGPATKQRVGDALTHGKLRLAGLAPPSGPGIAGGDGNTRNELYLWHYFGDPTMQMFGGGSPPIVFNPNIFKATYKELPIPKPGDPPPYLVELTFPSNPALTGQPISLLRNGEVIGKALAGDGSVLIAAEFNDGKPLPGELTVAFEADNAAPVQVGVDGVQQAPTTLTQNCPTANQQVPFGNSATVTMTGNLAGAPAGSAVAVSFKRPDRPGAGPPIPGPTTVVTATTDASGNWTASVTTSDRLDIGTWQVSSAFAGTAQYAASAAAACPVIVFDNS
jgi:hypothetical protein